MAQSVFQVGRQRRLSHGHAARGYSLVLTRARSAVAGFACRAARRDRIYSGRRLVTRSTARIDDPHGVHRGRTKRQPAGETEDLRSVERARRVNLLQVFSTSRALSSYYTL